MPSKPLKLGIMACGIALSFAVSTSWAAVAHQLQGVQLNSNEVETQIVLQSKNQIPYNVVDRSANQIVLDLMVSNPNQPIRTDFALAENIDHVVLKPLSGQKLRMIIRGTHLGQPVVMKGRQVQNNPSSELYDRQALVMEDSQPASVRVPDDMGALAMSAIAEEEKPQAKTPKQTSQQPDQTAKSRQSGKTTDTQPAPPTTEDGDILFHAGENPDEMEEVLDIDTSESGALFAEPELPSERPVLADNSMTEEEVFSAEGSSLLDQLPVADMNAIGSMIATNALAAAKQAGGFRMMILGGLAILWIALLKRKRQNPFRKAQFAMASQQETYYEDEYYDDRPPNEDGWLRDMMSTLFRFGQSARKPARARRQVGARIPQDPPARAPRPANERPVGLRGLQENYHTEPPAMPYEAYEPPSGTISNRTSALQQYAKQARPPARNAFNRSTEIDRELQRSLAMRGAIQRSQTKQPPAASPASRPAPASKTPKAGLPPGLPPKRTGTPALPPKKQGLQRPLQADPAAANPRISTPDFPRIKAGQSTSPRNNAPAKMPPRQPAAQPNNQQPGLPNNNTEVLDFLRSVAEMMEKDGKPELARGVKKGLQQP